VANASDPSRGADKLRAIGVRGPLAIGQLSELRAGLRSNDVAERAAAAWAFTQMGTAGRAALGDLTRSLADPDHEVRGLVALALRDAGPLSDSTIDALASRLVDPDDGVRMASAWAIAAQGRRAMRVFPALIAAGKAQPQHPHVQRAVADALGAIGPDAREALPVLEELAKAPRVRWNANAAIKKIRGESAGTRSERP
jgi:HEAT repeat protein